MNEYKQSQIIANVKKEKQVWASKDSIKYVSNYLKKYLPCIKNGICHGVRNGAEIAWFKEYLGPNVGIIGTEISHTAKKYPNTIQWDFHKIKKKWLSSFDFIYSNALDHSYNPDLCIRNWVSCLTEKGLCVIEWNRNNAENNATDPFGASLGGLKAIIKKHARVVLLKKLKDGNIHRFFFFIERL